MASFIPANQKAFTPGPASQQELEVSLVPGKALKMSTSSESESKSKELGAVGEDCCRINAPDSTVTPELSM